MSRSFGSLAALAEHLMMTAATEAVALGEGLKHAAKKIEASARAEMGEYQPAVGPFQAWDELADATKDDRIRQGYTENDPLLRSGELRDSFSHEVHGLEAAIGSTDERMPYHEFGTSKIPARPVFGPAAFKNKETIQKLVGAAALAGMIGADQVHAALGYDMKTVD